MYALHVVPFGTPELARRPQECDVIINHSRCLPRTPAGTAHTTLRNAISIKNQSSFLYCIACKLTPKQLASLECAHLCAQVKLAHRRVSVQAVCAITAA